MQIAQWRFRSVPMAVRESIHLWISVQPFCAVGPASCFRHEWSRAAIQSGRIRTICVSGSRHDQNLRSEPRRWALSTGSDRPSDRLRMRPQRHRHLRKRDALKPRLLLRTSSPNVQGRRDHVNLFPRCSSVPEACKPLPQMFTAAEIVRTSSPNIHLHRVRANHCPKCRRLLISFPPTPLSTSAPLQTMRRPGPLREAHHPINVG